MKELKYVGKDTPRPDVPDKVAGQAHYIHDLARPGMLYGKIRFSDQAHARVLNVDTRRAGKLPGVRAVLTGANTPPVRVGFLRDNLALKKDRVRSFRDELAVVIATDPEIAAEAVRLIDVDYEPLPGLFSPEQALADGAPLIHETDARGRPLTSNRMPLEYHHRSGDIEAGRAAAKTVVEGTYSTPWIQQACMGTAGCIAEFDLNSNLTIWAKTQIPFLAQRDFNRALKEMGLKGKNSRVIVPALGGGFGTGLDTHCYEYIAILAAYHTGRPVKMLYDRQEEFANLSPRQSATVRIAQGCDGDGKLTFREIHVLQDNGAYGSWGATYPSVMLLPATSLYRVENVRFDADLVYTNNTYSQAMRGYGNPEVTWALESNLDDLAEAAGIDPYELRKLNMNIPNETTPMGLKVSTCGLGECLEVTAKKLNWKEKRSSDARRAEQRKGTVKRGVGMASLIHVGGSGRIYNSDASGLIVKLDDFGNVNVYYGGVEMGQGLHSALSLTMADALGVTPDKVHINQTDTATCPWDVGTHASRGAFMACNAAILAAKELRTTIFSWCERVFADEIECLLKKEGKKNPNFEAPSLEFARSAKADDFELLDNRLTVKSGPDEPWAALDFDRFLRAIHFRPDGDMLAVKVFYDPPSELPDWSKGIGNMSATYTYGTQGVEVEVDEETGEVKILYVVSALDVGKVLNPQTLKGQVIGGLAQGVGYALYEEVKTHEGRILNPSFTDYKLPTAGEMAFPIDLEFIETDDAYGPYGAKGVGEPGLVPTAPAIGNAIYDAVGIRLYDLPMTPEKVLAALDAKRKGAR